MTDTKALIAAHRQEIEAEIKRLHHEVLRLQRELGELEVAERVLGRISGIAAHHTGPAEGVAGQDHPGNPIKPEGIPTMPEMIRASLQDARKRGLAGLEPKEMAEFISAKWWPNVPGVAISPIAWRMWKRGDLQKEDSRYVLPENVDQASESGWRSDWPSTPTTHG